MIPSLIIFASGGGSNAIAIHQHSLSSNAYQIACIISNKPDAAVLQYAAAQNIPSIVIDKKTFTDPLFLNTLAPFNASMLVLAGFLWKIPAYLIQAFPQQILNIHPSLLPMYGGKGMYGKYVHEAVLANGELQSGITIHVVNEEYDKGKILLQKSVGVSSDDTTESLAKKVLALEHAWYHVVIEEQLQTIKHPADQR
jgi:phosphoribosylglycinamide formyltransferase 1